MRPSLRFSAALALVLSLFPSGLALTQGARLSPDQFGLLADRLKTSASFKVRLQSALLLGTAGGAEAVPLLVGALHDDRHPAVRAAAALALGQTQDQRALDPLVGALSEEDPLLRGQAEKGLSQLTQALPNGSLLAWQALQHAPGAAREKGLVALQSAGAAGVPGLCDAAATGDEATKTLAREQLGKIPHEPLLLGLREALRMKDADVSPVAAALLGDEGDPLALPMLADVASDPTQPQEAISESHSALVRLSSQIDVAAEGRRFESEDPQERMRAVLLASIKGGGAAEGLAIRALADPNMRVQAAGASAVADLGAVQALPKLKALEEKEEEAPILRLLQIAVRRLERKAAAPQEGAER